MGHADGLIREISNGVDGDGGNGGVRGIAGKP